MTTIFQRSVSCSHCGGANNVVELGSTNEFGSMDLDMRPPPMKRDTLAQQIHRCAKCSYCAPDLEEPVGSADQVGASEYQSILTDDTYPNLARQFLAYAFLAESSGDLGSAAHAYRNAAWVCDDQANEYADASRHCRNAVLRLMKVLRLKGQTFTNDTNSDSVLELDLLRRSGRHDEVRTKADALTDKPMPEILQSILMFQRQRAVAGDVSCYKVSDALEHSDRSK